MCLLRGGRISGGGEGGNILLCFRVFLRLERQWGECTISFRQRGGGVGYSALGYVCFATFCVPWWRRSDLVLAAFVMFAVFVAFICALVAGDLS